MIQDNRGLLQKAWNYLVYNSEDRVNLENPQTPLNDATLETLWGIPAEDKPVNLKNSLSVTAYLRAVNLKSETQGSLPFNIIKVLGEQNREIDYEHPAYRLLNEEFNPTMGAFEARRLMQSHVETLGNGFAEIIRKGNGDPKELWVLNPDNVKLFFRNRKLFYEVDGIYEGGEIKQKGRMISADNMFHVKGFSLDGYVGIPSMELAKDALGIAISSNAFVNRFYKNNAMPSMVVSVEQRLNPESAEELKEQWDKNYGGTKQGKTAVLGMGAKISPVTMPLDQAQLADIQRFSVIEIARMMSVPPHLLYEMERETYTNIETANMGYVRDTIRPMSIEWEQEANKKLLRNIQRKRRTHFTEHDLFGLLRGDSEAQANFYQSLSNVGAMNANEIRKQFNWNGIGELGDKYWMQLGFAPVEQIVDKLEADISQVKKTTEKLDEPAPEVVVEKEEDPQKKDIDEQSGKQNK